MQLRILFAGEKKLCFILQRKSEPRFYASVAFAPSLCILFFFVVSHTETHQIHRFEICIADMTISNSQKLGSKNKDGPRDFAASSNELFPVPMEQLPLFSIQCPLGAV